jgi:hypothetical protein
MSLLLAAGGAGSPVNYVLTCASGSYSYTGVAASLNVAHSLVCDAGAYAYSGNAATLTYTPGAAKVDYVLSCSAGSYAYSGQPASLLYVAGAIQVIQGGVKKLNLRAQFRGVETEDQKRLRREAAGIIARAKKAEPADIYGLQVEAEDVSGQLQDAIAQLELAASAFTAELRAKEAKKATIDAKRLQLLLVDAQLQIETMQQQVEELDVAFIVMMIAAHI